MKLLKYILIIAITLTSISCISYSFTGASIPEGTNSFQVNFFQNNSQLIEPGIDRDFTNTLTDLLRDQTSLELVKFNGDLVYEGEIIDYRVSPTTATANNTAAQNRLTIRVNVRYFNKKDPEADFEQPFSFFFDFEGAADLSPALRTTAQEEIFERITQDIFNASLANW
ncbi:hypothetical protein D7030_14395 [Flavobacteriaceae bacterium AU392]|nr:hypothetical protein D1817_04095 [Flavobacteriaceae bacterium]RKM81490.1 hypothetical protein D7030_14395 [Flavobacteriaceae bacterium AU392]